MSDRPSVIVIMTDQQKATASHLYGNTFCQTPSMARLAEEGVLFEHAFTPYPLCTRARVSLWTSMYPHQHGGRRNEIWTPAGATHAFQLMVRTHMWKYVHDPMGDLDELYDLVSDPWELQNVAADPAYRNVLSEMRLRLLNWSIETEDGLPVPLP